MKNIVLGARKEKVCAGRMFFIVSEVDEPKCAGNRLLER
jgi:hypothetical protein